jgi:hypothetical protein
VRPRLERRTTVATPTEEGACSGSGSSTMDSTLPVRDQGSLHPPHNGGDGPVEPGQRPFTNGIICVGTGTYVVTYGRSAGVPGRVIALFPALLSY